MRLLALAAAMAALLIIGLPADPAQAHHRSSYGFSYSSGGVSVYVGRAPRYYYAPPRRYYYYAPPRYYYAPPRRSYYYYQRPRVRTYRRAHRSCGYWHNRCVANWGHRGANYRGCMRYHRC